jgi:hypothetical protein
MFAPLRNDQTPDDVADQLLVMLAFGVVHW